MRIGEVAGEAGVSTRALRYYEEQGLLESERTHGGQRIYPDSAVERVRLIQKLFTAGLPSRTVRDLMPCIETGHASFDVVELMAAERHRISTAMDDLAAARDALDRMIAIANHPTPEHCPTLREPAWATYSAPTSPPGPPLAGIDDGQDSEDPHAHGGAQLP